MMKVVMIGISFVFLLLITECCARKRYSNSGGIYHYSDRNTGRVQYVGATNNFARRHSEHVRGGDSYANNYYQTFPMKGATKGQVAEAERSHIKYFQPSSNKNKGGGGL